jgi:hypothetical protein
MRLAPRVSISAWSSAPQRDCASVAFGPGAEVLLAGSARNTHLTPSGPDDTGGLSHRPTGGRSRAPLAGVDVGARGTAPRSSTAPARAERRAQLGNDQRVGQGPGDRSFRLAAAVPTCAPRVFDEEPAGRGRDPRWRPGSGAASPRNARLRRQPAPGPRWRPLTKPRSSVEHQPRQIRQISAETAQEAGDVNAVAGMRLAPLWRRVPAPPMRRSGRPFRRRGSR